jgi:lipoprotein-anchoring transpeptidase ErfK/SrfK
MLTMRRALVLLAFVALGAAAPAHAQPEPVVPEGVTIGGLAVGGLTESQATAAVQARFDQPLAIRIRRAGVNVLPATLGARARVFVAVRAALKAREGAAVPLEVVLNERKLRGWIAGRERRFYRAPRNSAVVLRDLRPWVTESKPGRKLLPYYSRLRIQHALRHHLRGPVRMATRDLVATRTRSNFGPVVVIRRGSKRLVYYRGSTASGMSEVARFGVATGMAAYPTPLGRFTIVTRQRHPWWYPPSAGWAAGAKPIPPGPGNPLGTRWMGLSVGAVGIHGTPDAASIGYSASHGCIRMRIPDAEWLFDRVRVGTTVFIVGA